MGLGFANPLRLGSKFQRNCDSLDLMNLRTWFQAALVHFRRSEIATINVSLRGWVLTWLTSVTSACTFCTFFGTLHGPHGLQRQSLKESQLRAPLRAGKPPKVETWHLQRLQGMNAMADMADMAISNNWWRENHGHWKWHKWKNLAHLGSRRDLLWQENHSVSENVLSEAQHWNIYEEIGCHWCHLWGLENRLRTCRSLRSFLTTINDYM